ncbi:MAG: IS66 family transposase [Nitrosomonadales bacterium]|nr:IS66 family transposase [Nitrosomonadales bacterium]
MKRTRIEINLGELDQLLERAQVGPLSAAECNKIKTALHTLAEAVMKKRSTEKTRAVMGAAKPEPPAGAAAAEKQGEKGKQGKGHGRTPASDYSGARQVAVPHPCLRHGDLCPECPKGKVYTQKEPRPLVRVVGQAPLAATVYQLDQLRCNACGQVYTAPAPEGVGAEKYDATVAVVIALLKYGSGVPFYRIAKLQSRFGLPMPMATLWEIVEEAADSLKRVLEEMIRQAAQGELFHNDDTSVRILKLVRPAGDERTGVFTSAVLSVVRVAGVEVRMALFFSGREHAGENLAKVLKQRAAQLGPAIQMSDALSRNVSQLSPGVELLLSNCLAHGRRNFVDVAENFPAECGYVLETLGTVYANDAVAKERKMTPGQRLEFHQRQSKPPLAKLQEWMKQQFDERKVEPNSGLGKAIKYLQNHWDKLTLFLREPGAPLDNNICERALKLVVLHRKNALFYRTVNGARVGDLFMSLIHTCALNGVNSFDYLSELLRHQAEIAASPRNWMPWNYRETLARAAAAA